MKRIIIAICIILTLFLVACSDKQTGIVYEVGQSDSENSISEVKLSAKTYKNLLAKKTKSYTLYGKEYELEYLSSVSGYLYNQDVDIYKYISDSETLQVQFNKKTGKTDGFLWSCLAEQDRSSSEIRTEEQCKDAAYEYFESLTSDAAEYALTDTIVRNATEYTKLYIFEYSRMIEEFKTSDKSQIYVDAYGKIVGYLNTSLGSMKGAVQPNQKYIDGVYSQLKDKLENKYSTKKDKNGYSYEDYSYETNGDNMVFVRLTNGKYAFDINVTATLSVSDRSWYENSRYIVYLD